MALRDVIGHRTLVPLLQRAVGRESLPPSLIFAGPVGVGKSTVAVALAQLLNCERLAGGARHVDENLANGLDACGTCGSCRRIAKAAESFRTRRERPAIDCLQWLEPDEKGSVKIDAVRAVLSRAGYRPFDGRRRVVVVRDAEMLEVGAQQALLKMLEEPPAATRFVLATAQPDALLPTIRSRCPVLRFARLSTKEVADGLCEWHGWDPNDALVAAAMADGCLGRALEGRDATSARARDVAADVLEHVAGSRAPLERLDAAQVLAARGEMGKGRTDGGRGRGSTASRQEMSARLEAMTALLRDIAVLTTRADRGRLANADLSSRLDGLSPAFSGDRLTRAFAVVNQARTALDRNASQKVVADWVVLHL